MPTPTPPDSPAETTLDAAAFAEAYGHDALADVMDLPGGVAIPAVPSTGKAAPRPYGAPLDVRRVVDASWLWRPWLPRGHITLVSGMPGCGKTSILIDLLARLARGDDLPGAASLRAPAGVRSLFVSYEETYGRWSAKAASAKAPSELTYHNDGDTPPALDDVEAWARTIDAGPYDVIVVDPADIALPPRCDPNDVRAVNATLAALVDVLEPRGTAMVLVRHLNKKVGLSAIERVSGSVAWQGIPRSVIVVGDSKSEDGSVSRVLGQNKCSDAEPYPRGLGFRFGPPERDGLPPTVEWTGELEVDADTIVMSRQDFDPTAGPKMRQAEALLHDLLASDRRVPLTEIRDRAKEQQISWRTMETAKAKLKISHDRSARGDTRWYFQAREDETP